jgi:hypothetical protein
MTRHQINLRGRRYRPQAIALVVGGAGAMLSACADSNVPFFTAPISVANSAAGIQNSVAGLFSSLRFDQGDYIIEVGAGYARDGSVFTNTEARTVEYPLGVFPEPSSWAGDWAQEYQNIAQANATLAAIPKVNPAYLPDSARAVWGLVETLKALDYMIVAESHDTLGMDVQPYPVGTSLPPAVCNKNGWQYIVALLDSANDSLTAAGAIALPVKVPKGFAGVASTVAPSTTLGSFASFNRIMAAKANLELAYAIARTPSGGPNAPTASTAGTPDPGHLTIALADLNASAMWDPTAASLAPNSPQVFAADARNVLHDFSATSGDYINQIFNSIGTIAQLNDFVADVDTVNDLRWKAKFILNPNPVQVQKYNPTASKYLYAMSLSPSSAVPLVREESMTLWAAEIALAQGNFAQALTYVNNVRTKVGGLTAYPASDAVGATAYVTVRNDLMHEQRISTTWEASLDRTIAIRMYGMAAASDTTWTNPGGGTEDPAVHVTDAHTTVEPIPSNEINGRGGAYTTTCN